MIHIARLAIAYPRRTLVVWFLFIAVLGALGGGVEDRLHRSTFDIPGTGSDHATKLTTAHFGERNTLIILLRGPRPRLDVQGRRLVAKLDDDPKVTVLAPWTRGVGDALRPDPGAAMVLVRVDRPFEQVSRETAPEVRSEVDRLISKPVSGYVGGFADTAAGAHDSTIEAIKRSELIAAPLLLIILLLVFRSPVAAALPLLVGVTTIGAGSGALDLVNQSVRLDQLALNLVSMMGLALGVDYGLVLVSRFREELDEGHPTVRAAEISVATAGRTVVWAGVTLALAMLGATVVAPGSLLQSGTFGVLIAVAFSLIGALVALPAALTLLGPSVNRWRIGGVLAGEGRLAAVAMRTLRRPLVAALLVTGLLLALAAPALSLDSGPGDPRMLPHDSPQRADFDKIRGTLKGAWAAPYEVTVASRHGAVTEPKKLRALARWQRQTAHLHDVEAVLGPGRIYRRSRKLEAAPDQVATFEHRLKDSIRDQRRLADGLAQARDGAQQLRGGLDQAAAGADQLDAGGAAGSRGARLLAIGLARAVEGARQVDRGLAAANVGGGRIARGARATARGSEALEGGLVRARDGLSDGLPDVEELADKLREGADGLEKLREPVQTSERQLGTALRELDAMQPTSKIDPAYARAYEAVAQAYGALSGRDPQNGRKLDPAYNGVDAALVDSVQGVRSAADGADDLTTELRDLARGLDRLAAGATQLTDGAQQLAGGAGEFEKGLDTLKGGSEQLLVAMQRLSGGGTRLAVGIRRLSDGLGELEGGLTDGADQTGALADGIEQIRTAVVGGTVKAKRIGRGLDGSKALGDTVESGYFVLAALDSAPRAERSAASFAINVDRGGSAAQMVVIAAGDPYDVIAAGHPLRGELQRSLDDLGRKNDLEIGVGGPAAQLQDFDTATSSRLVLLVLVLTVVTFLALVVVLRSVFAPLLAVTLNLLTIAAAFGVLALLFGGTDAPLGDAGFLDGISLLAIFAIAFGLSIDYEVFMLARMREGYLLTGTTDGSIAYGLPRTAHVITGGALIMTGVFAAFAFTDVLTTRQIGIGLLVAVLLDATLVRLVLLPAAMRLMGEWTWWLPEWISRLLPEQRAAQE